MRLVIVESPNKVASIQKYLGEGWQVMASYGHVRDLPISELGVDVTGDFGMTYVPGERSKATIAKIAKAAKAADEVYLATDPDREGEAIAWHVLDAANIPVHKVKRATFTSITQDAVRAAVAAPRKIDMDLVSAQEARRALDRLVGWLISPALSNAAQQRLSAGRVQSPAVRLVVEREAQIVGFKPTNHFGAELAFDGWKAVWDTKPHLAEGEEYILDRGLAEQAAASRVLKVAAYETKPAREAPPAPFSTSTLLQAASVKLGLDPDRTMQLAQLLFEAGVITYHRSDALNFEPGAVASIRDVLMGSGIPVPESPRTFREAASAQAGHEAIRPTDLQREKVESGNPQADMLYVLIRLRALASQAADAEYQAVSVRLESGEFAFTAKSRTLTAPGWRQLVTNDDTEEADEGEENQNGNIPVLAVGASVTAIGSRVLEKTTKAPARYTQASLIKKLESLGIGRPSTYAAILKNITDRGYIGTDKRKIRALPTGIALVRALVGARCGFTEYAFTKKLENQLDEIASGTRRYADVLTPAYQQIVDDADRVARVDMGLAKVKCPKCGEGFMRRISGKKGVFWGCSVRECGHTMDDDGGKPIERKSYPCPSCGQPMYRRKGASGAFWGCSAFSEGCKTTLPDERGKPGKPKPKPEVSEHLCPKCGKGLVHRQKAARGKAKGFNFWGCSGYPGCDFSTQDVGGKPKESG